MEMGSCSFYLFFSPFSLSVWNCIFVGLLYLFLSAFDFGSMNGCVRVCEHGEELSCNKDTKVVPQISHVMPSIKVKFMATRDRFGVTPPGGM